MIECMKGAGGRMYSGCFVRVEDICYGDASSQPGVNNFEKKSRNIVCLESARMGFHPRSLQGQSQ